MSAVYQFGGFRFDPGQRRLTTDTGVDVALAPRAIDALAILVSRPGELVHKSALMERLWPDTVVGDNSLDQIISQLRRKLTEVQGRSDPIVTERGRGYRFVAQVSVVSTDAAPQERRWGSETADAGGRDPHARQLYAQARTLSVRPSADNLRAASQLLEAAVARDPSFVLALAHHALLRTVLLAFDIGAPAGAAPPAADDPLASAERDARAALERQPDLARAHQALANICVARGAWLEAAGHFERASALEPEPDARVTRIWQIRHAVGHLRQARVEAERLDPFTASQPLGSVALAGTALLLDDDDAAQAHVERACAFGWPQSNPALQDMRFQLALRSGRWSDAADVVTRDMPRPMRRAGASRVVARVCAAVGDSSARREAAAAVRALTAAVSADALGMVGRRRIVLWLAIIGALDEAFEAANAALDDYARRGMIGLAWSFLWLREMAPFRRDARFATLARRLRLTDYWAEAGPPDDPAVQALTGLMSPRCRVSAGR